MCVSEAVLSDTPLCHRYQNLRPVHNHPAALTRTKSTDKWWETTNNQKLLTCLNRCSVLESNKLVALLHIIVKSIKMGDKVMVFANSLPTLDYVEDVLALEDWKKHVPSLAKGFPDDELGGWERGKHFLRYGRGAVS